MVVGITYCHGTLGPVIEILGKPLSLINQVLQNVEARQGGVSLDGQADVTGWGAQVKPVLLHQGEGAGRWLNRLGWMLVLLACAGGLLLNWPRLMSLVAAVQSSESPSTVATPTVVSSSAAVVNEGVVAPMPEVIHYDEPQLTKSLFSDWQTKPAEVAHAAPVRIKPSAEVVPIPPKKPVVSPQIEGEFSIKPAEEAVVSTVVVNSEATIETKTSEGESAGPKGVVSKQVRPGQEVNLLIQRAIDHEQKGRLNEAIATLRNALQSYPQAEDARQLLATYLFDTKQEAEAITVLQAGIKQYPTQIGLSKTLAKWQLAHGLSDQVVQTLKPVAQLLTQDPDSQWMLAMAYQHTGQHVASLPHFERAIALRPGVGQWLVAYAISLQSSGQPAQALQQLQMAYTLPLSERLSEFVGQRIRQLGGATPARSE